jgi:hypothetical protein
VIFTVPRPPLVSGRDAMRFHGHSGAGRKAGTWNPEQGTARVSGFRLSDVMAGLVPAISLRKALRLFTRNCPAAPQRDRRDKSGDDSGNDRTKHAENRLFQVRLTQFFTLR